MLEGLVAWVLNNYLGKYVENLNTDQLSIAILSGEVELENLPLRKDALRHLGIPIEIRAGHIGKVKLQIPIRSLRSSPWIIVIERLYLVAGPLSLDEWDQNAEDLADQERKLAALDAIEACWRLEADSNLTNVNSSSSSHYASSYSSWLSYGTGVITDIVENMQLHVKEVHIRYEDSTSLSNNCACVCGLTIESLSAQSCDLNWVPQFMTHRDGSDLSFKTIELKNLAVYWDNIDPKCDLTSKLSPSELAAALSEKSEGKRRYLVAPVSACAKLQRNRSDLPLRSVNSPRIICDLNLDQVQLTLVDWQYSQMVSCSRGLEFLSRVQHHRRRRPSVSVTVDPRAWWSYACSCHVPGALRTRLTWGEALERARENVQYVELYEKLLATPTVALGVELKRWQYSQMVSCSRGLEFLSRVQHHRRRRPSVPVTVDPRAWWSYACSCHVPGALRTRLTWGEALERARENVQYVELYEKLLATPTVALGVEVKRIKDLVEWSRDFDELRALREVAMRRCPLKTNTNVPTQISTQINTQQSTSPETSSTGRNVLVRWFPQWWGWYSTSEGPTEEKDVTLAPQAVSPTKEGSRQLEDEILEALADSAKNNTLLRRDVVFGRFNFTLNGGILELCASNAFGAQGVPMLELQFSELVAEVVSRPRSSSYSLELRLGALYLRDRLTHGTLFPVLVGPPGDVQETSTPGLLVRGQQFRNRQLSATRSGPQIQFTGDHPFFTLTYSSISTSLRRLHVTSRPLDVVYQPAAVKWLLEFACAPHQRSAARHRLEEMRERTKQQLTDTWGSMLQGKDKTQRNRGWDLRLDVSAPQLILVERFCDPGAAIAVVDLGTLRLENGYHHQNGAQGGQAPQKPSPEDDEDDDEAFMTPCSTPPGSEADEDVTQNLVSTLSELSLHQRIYDTYSIELSDIQVLVGRVKDNWRHAHTKGSSNLHVLDRFNISLTIERRIVPTTDPMYPSVTLCANLPRLVAHINEQKISAVKTLTKVISDASLPSPFSNSSPTHEMSSQEMLNPSEETSTSVNTPVAEEDGVEPSRLLTVQFTVDQMSLEVQSRGRCVAELQVSGVTASLSRRPSDLSISLTVHGLLLVDALQTFGPDFELLVASHRHVGMDSMSGSLRDSEPTSPVSPGSPDPGSVPRMRPTSPVALSRALREAVSIGSPSQLGVQGDHEALICVEYVYVKTEETVQLASIQFNNLDIIANQETIVELVGFIRRVFPNKSPRPQIIVPQPSVEEDFRPRSRTTSKSETAEDDVQKLKTRTELTFDFHRLNVLLLRATVEDGRTIGRKIGTSTMCEARIQATVDSSLFVRGSLGGLQVLDLTPEGHLHQRIISVGRDPLAEETFNFTIDRGFKSLEDTSEAFSFSVKRNLKSSEELTPVDVSIRMASVWYTHSPQFLGELRSCATEFKQYLSDVARSIRSAATDVALGLVHARTEQLAHSLYSKAGLAYDVASPRRLRRKSTSSEPHTPFTPLGEDDDDDGTSFDATNVRLDVVLDSPVLVLPRSSNSCHVLVAHLGKITISNTWLASSEDETIIQNIENPDYRTYEVQIRDMNICTLDTSLKRGEHFGGGVQKVDIIYNCENALPVLHDTLLKLQVTKLPPERLSGHLVNRSAEDDFQGPGGVLDAFFEGNVGKVTKPPPERLASHLGNKSAEDDVQGPGGGLDAFSEGNVGNGGLLKIKGCVVNALRISLTRAQYEQVLDTLQWLGKDDGPTMQNSTPGGSAGMSVIAEEDVGGVSTLSMDPHVRAKLFPSASRRRATSSFNINGSSLDNDDISSEMRVQVRFEVASFGVELCGVDGSGLVGLSFGEFLLTWSTPRKWETELQVSLRTLLVEDLLREKGAFGRQMIASKNENDDLTLFPPFVSKSCPDSSLAYQLPHFGSLPDRLDTRQIYGAGAIPIGAHHHIQPSQGHLHLQRTRGQDLVLITSKFVDPSAPNFKTDFESIRKTTSVDLGSIDVVVSASSWLSLMDFFSVNSQEDSYSKNTSNLAPKEKIGDSKTFITIRSLTLQALRNSRYGSLARAKVTGAHLDITRQGSKRRIKGQLGALQIRHPDKENSTCRGERFVTIGERALDFRYSCPPEVKNDLDLSDSELILEISPFVYVHTKKFTAELKAFLADFSRNDSTAKTVKKKSANILEPSRMFLKLSADACVTLLPVNAGNANLLVLDVGRLTAENVFTQTVVTCDGSLASEGSSTFEEVLNLDVTTWKLHDVDVYVAKAKERDIVLMNTKKETTLVFGDCTVVRTGGSLLADKCLLELRVDRNLQPSEIHRKNGVADMTINCRLSTLEASLSVEDYALIRGILTHNLGEDTEHILPSVIFNTSAISEDIWTLTSLRIELLDVKVHLQSLACINFVRSRLTVDSFSDLSQDIDLVSRQILITDERRKKSNVFEVILKPVSKGAIDGTVQAEIHSRRRQDKSKFTVLLNNMRLMAIPDWWKLASEFIFVEESQEEVTVARSLQEPVIQQQVTPFELKLNITESEIVVVEDSAKSDTNAVILRSTTLLTYRPNLSPGLSSEGFKPLSCSVNHLELFSCRFLSCDNAAEDTALSIVDPVTISAEVSSSILEIQLHELTIRVSYRDILLFAAILDSFSKQTSFVTTKKVKIHDDVAKLTALGFSVKDCEKSLELCGQIDDAALWLTQHAVPRASPQRPHNSLDIKTIELKASVLRFCLIDDCGDVDVPLAEATLTNLTVTYDLETFGAQQYSNASVNSYSGALDPESGAVLIDSSISGSKTTSIEGTISLDYYNRVLGGWEPFLESWKCRAIWKPEDNLTSSRHRVALHSDDILDINITDSLLALVRLVQESWTKEIGAPRITPRCPFVPYSLRNDTGSSLYFATVVTDPDEPVRSLEDFEDVDGEEKYRDLKWTEVPPGETTPFTYHSSHSKQRHAETHQLRSHQLCVRVHGWQPCFPVTVDRVGVYFRSVAPDRRAEPNRITAPRSARLVFDVKLDGSARKLVIVRSGMVLVNKLVDSVDVKLVERSAVNAVSTSSRTALLPSFSSFPLPLIHSHSHIFIRPSDDTISYSYCQPDVPWARVMRPGERGLFPLRCSTNRGDSYFVCCEVRRERFPFGDVGHTVILLPVLMIVNLLPQDLHFTITANSPSGDDPSSVISKGRVSPGQSMPIPSADPDCNLDLSFHLENFRCASGITIPSSLNASATSEGLGGEFSTRVRLEDSERRRLFLRARIEPGRGSRMRVTLTAPYWIVNRTGLPLVFKQEGFTADTAGQFEEHELARMVAPLLFSFADQDASPMVVARVGYRYGGGKQTSGTPHFCQQFHLRRGVQVRRLRVSHEQGPDTVYVVGIEVRAAKGRRRHQHTNIVTVSPRHLLLNRSGRTLEFAQQCHAGSVADPGAKAYRVHAPAGSHVPFHWPRLDRDQLLCLRVANISTQNAPFSTNSAWSGGLRIDTPLSNHIIVRDVTTGARLCFLHAEVIPHGATYCLVVSDAGDLPPPLRIDNCSEVAVTFSQWGAHMGPTVAHAHRAVPYAWDEPSGVARVVVTAPGGVSATYDVDKLGRGTQLTYENFIYVAFTGTFYTEDDLDHYDESDYSSTSFPTSRRLKKSSEHSSLSRTDSMNPVRLQRLVLDVPEGSSSVLLAKKKPGKRSQLWRMTSTGQLQHEGSSATSGGPLVLDIEPPAPQPSAPRPARLALRRPDPRRKSTQTWRFAPDGRLCCAHRNTCVQAMDGLLGLRPGSPAVLGPISDSPTHRSPSNNPSGTPVGPPLQQSVGKQRMRPGSGLLAVEITTDGPTRVIRIIDMKQRDPGLNLASADDDDWQGVALAHRPVTDTQNVVNPFEIQVTIMLRAGLGISIVGAARELLYFQLNNIIAEAVCGLKSQEFCVSVQDAQCDNQLPSSSVPVVLHAARARNAADVKKAQTLPVLELRAEMSPSAGSVLIFKHLIVCVRPLSIHLEEILLLRMYEFLLNAAGVTVANDEDDDGASTDLVDESGDGADEETITGAATLGQTPLGTTRRYHFGIIRLVPGPVRLSVHTAGVSTLGPRLRSLKRRLGLTLVGFEDAPVELEPYVRHHPFETGERLRRSILDHFRDELLWQAANILGSVDFLGSPLGLLGDVSEGVSGLIRERSVGALVLNVAHGLSNSAAKVTETLGDGLGRVAMDDAHEEMRQRIRRRHTGTGGAHLVAGIKGLGFGILGGATGIFKQVYEGASSEGLQGVFSGLGKGLVGAVAKPVVGVLDLATETARAVRDSSRGSSRLVPDRRRQPRATLGPGGLLPPYNPRDSRGQAYLRELSSNRHRDLPEDSDDLGPTEQYVAYECVRSGADDLRVIVSSERIRVVTGGGTNSDLSSSLTVVTETGLDGLVSCTPLTHEGRHYIEMTVRGASLRRPLIRCDSEELARSVTRQINYAKRLYEEATHTLRVQDD